MKRSAPIKRQTRVKPVNAKRKRKNFARANGSKARVLFVKSLPCVFGSRRSRCEGEIHNHHVETGGMGRKADAAAIVPVCTRHHGHLHQYGAAFMESHHDVDLKTAAALTETRWRISNGE